MIFKFRFMHEPFKNRLYAQIIQYFFIEVHPRIFHTKKPLPFCPTVQITKTKTVALVAPWLVYLCVTPPEQP
jgi:hypothetical protein